MSVSDAQRIDLMLAETEVTTIEILIQYAQLSPAALGRIEDALTRIRQALKAYRGTLQ